MYSLKGTNIVLLAENHNPSIPSKDWLIKNEIIKADENITNFVHTPAFSVLETDIINFTVDPDRLQISIKAIRDENIKYLINFALVYVSSLPETPYNALGINYIYDVTFKKEELKKLFATDEKRFEKLFGPDYNIGGIIEYKYENFIVKLQMKFVNNITIADFNYHLKSNKPEIIKNNIRKYNELLKNSKKIFEGLK